MNMKCISCGKAKLVRDMRDEEFTYKGETTLLVGIPGDYCPNCGDSIHTYDDCKIFDEAVLAFKKEVNAAIVEPKFIVETRKKLKLDQRQAAEIFGGGANAFSRYETGKTRPSLALVQLLRILSKHPELLQELKELPEEPGPNRTITSKRSTGSSAIRRRKIK